MILNSIINTNPEFLTVEEGDIIESVEKIIPETNIKHMNIYTIIQRIHITNILHNEPNIHNI